MRDHFGADWAFGIRGAIEKIVRENYPQHIRQWPLMAAFDFEAYDLGSGYACFVLKDKMSGIPMGPGQLRPFPVENALPLPPQFADLERWQFYLRSQFKLKPDDVAIVIPVYDSGKGAPADYDLFTAEEQIFWNTQIMYNIAQYKAHLDTFQKVSPPPSVNITYNVSGQNSRVNINSTDASTNTFNEPASEVFDRLMQAAASIAAVEERKKVEAAIAEMQQAYKTGGFATRYKEFISIVSDHLSVFGPILPALSQLL